MEDLPPPQTAPQPPAYHAVGGVVWVGDALAGIPTQYTTQLLRSSKLLRLVDCQAPLARTYYPLVSHTAGLLSLLAD